MRVSIDSYDTDSDLPKAWDVLSASQEPMVLLKIFAGGNHPRFEPCQETDEALLIPVSVVERLSWKADFREGSR